MSSATWAGKRALVADDNEDSRKLATLVLKREGLIVSQAENGRQAVDQACATPPDLILMDLEMPVMGGLEAIRDIRAGGRAPGARIIALSAHAAGESRELSLAAGADGYLVKPLRMADLQKALATLLA